MLLPWLFGKFAFYCSMSWFALALFGFYVANKTGFVVRYAFYRLAVGIFGAICIMALWTSVMPAGEWLHYFMSFGVVRYAEWTIVLSIMAANQYTNLFRLGWRGQLWIWVGVAGNVGFDRLAVALGFTDIKFGC
ncbi:MAG TPA: hypothetical protein VMF52_20435 [Steroidobacteraceae bacterium]|nr:hypothetical protein [Steroidobacteraceae bacterium]